MGSEAAFSADVGRVGRACVLRRFGDEEDGPATKHEAVGRPLFFQQSGALLEVGARGDGGSGIMQGPGTGVPRQW